MTASAEDTGNLAQSFGESVRRHGGRDALVWKGGSLDYAGLGKVVSAAALILGREGVVPGSRVALVGANDPAWVVAFLAAQRVGAVTVEIARQESPETIRGILERTHPAIVLTDLADLLSERRGGRPTRSFSWILGEALAGAPRAAPLAAARMNRGNPASIVFTSGTTGPPKGVVLSHGNFLSVTEAVVEYLGLEAQDRYGLLLPLCHTYGKSNLLTSLAVGAAVVLLDDFADLPRFLESLAKHRITVLSLVPYHGVVLARRADPRALDLPRLRAMTFSGNRLLPETADALREHAPRVRLFSMYGLTESTTRATWLPPEKLTEKRGSCGKPIRGMEIRILGDDGQVLPPSQTGRVELRGPNVMLGYFEEPKLTSETIADGWLRTGDLGRLDEEGYLYLEGREKDIIKCAGERICPEEIESVLASHPQVEEVAVVGILDPVLGEAVEAHVVGRGGFRDAAALRVHCVGRLAPHKLPRRYVFVESLPRTPTGKVRKVLLRQKGPEGASPSRPDPRGQGADPPDPNRNPLP